MGLLGTTLGRTQGAGQVVSDAVLRLNPLIQPKERYEKRQYVAINTPDALWQTTVCGKKTPPVANEPEKFSRVSAQLGKLATQISVPVLSNILVRSGYQATARPGFYFYFKTTHAFLRLPQKRPENFISATGKYMNCGSSDDLIVDQVIKNSISIDYRKFALIQGDQVSYPSHEVATRNMPPDINGFKDKEAYLRPLTGPDIWPREDSKWDNAWIEEALYYDLLLRPIRFRLELPPMTVQGIEVPLPTCFFEPFDISTNKFVGA